MKETTKRLVKRGLDREMMEDRETWKVELRENFSREEVVGPSERSM